MHIFCLLVGLNEVKKNMQSAKHPFWNIKEAEEAAAEKGWSLAGEQERGRGGNKKKSIAKVAAKNDHG